MRDDDRAIRDLVATYCHAIAERDDAAWADTWAQDGEWVVLGKTVRGRAAILEHYKKLISGVRWVVQQTTDGILEIEGDAARGRWQIVEFLQWSHGAGGQNVARYRDDYTRCSDGHWRFQRRALTATYFGPAHLDAPAQTLPSER